VMYQWALSDLGKLGWLAAFIYTACAALRLARFNTQVGIADKRYFQGLPSPSAAAIVAGMVWSGEEVFDLAGKTVEEVAFVLTILAGLLMVSNIRYHSFKGINFKERVPFVAILLALLVIVVVSSNPPVMLFGGFLVYAISGPVLTVVYLRRRRAERKAQHQQESDSGEDHLEKP
jgi:CDP-diacylglycerol--serine O-phosphatidyltransferase